MGRHRLPDSVMIVAAGNRVEDGAIAYDMGTALSDRLIHMIVAGRAPRIGLKHYAIPAGIHPSVAAFHPHQARPAGKPPRTACGVAKMIACTPPQLDAGKPGS